MVKISVGVLLIFIALVVCLATLREGSYDREVAEAVEFCDQLIPKLEARRQETGRYPERIDHDWYEGPVPDLIRLDEFYIAEDNGESYLLRVRDPRIDPRFWFNDVYGYSSRVGRWQQYDGY